MEDKTSERKANHIDLAFKSQIETQDSRFNYEPLLSAHPVQPLPHFSFLKKAMHFPLWISSMTGGTEKAAMINKNLGKAAGKYGLGMGLGSCRIILEDDTYLPDFQLRKYITNDFPFYANLGIAQLEELIQSGKLELVKSLIDKTETDGLIIHVNPFQEWLQPEGDRFKVSPLQTIEQVIDVVDTSIIVKEVGQGFGPKSLEALFKLDIDAIDFGAHGGTNFSAVELHRAEAEERNHYSSLAAIGHSAEEMVDICNTLTALNPSYKNKQIIISGGVKSFLDGYYLNKKLRNSSVYAQASELLKYASVGFDAVDAYIEKEIAGYQLATQYLDIRT
ncbi:MAG: isopentenyl-diphosphate delta-isomerase [Bacteroidia bacterium]|jgi:isopentenyl-diphosphate delta-isomerase